MPPEQVLLGGAKGRFCQFKIDLNSSLEAKTETTPKPYNQTSLDTEEPGAFYMLPCTKKKGLVKKKSRAELPFNPNPKPKPLRKT